MKILHIALASHFTIGMLYQENQMINCQRADGHDVTIVTDLWHYERGELVKGEEEDPEELLEEEDSTSITYVTDSGESHYSDSDLFLFEDVIKIDLVHLILLQYLR